MAVYSRNTALLRFQYDRRHQHAYGYLFPPTGGFAAWTGPRPCEFHIHGGGYAQPGYDETNDRFPAVGMISSTAVPDAFANGGAAVIILEYPLGSGLERPDQTGAAATHFPRNWLVLAKAFQWVKDQCEPGGALYGLIDPTQLFAYCWSAGAHVTMMSQWSPKSWGAVKRSPGPQLNALNPLPKNDHYLRAMVLAGPPVCPAQDDPARIGAQTGVQSPIIACAASPGRYRPRVRLSGTVVESAPGVIDPSGPVAQVFSLTSGTPGALTGTIVAYTPGSPATVELLVEKGIATGFGGSDTFALVGDAGTTLTVTATPVILDRYGWGDMPQARREALSPLLFLDGISSSDLDQIRRVALFAFNSPNPHVSYRAGDSLRDKLADKYGADDSHDVWQLEARINALGGFTAQFRWGSNPPFSSSAQLITAATNANPVVCSIAGPQKHGIRSGDEIVIAGAQGLTSINGTHIATRINDQDFSVPVAGNGTYSGSGVWGFNNPLGSWCDPSTILQEFYEWLRDEAGITKLGPFTP